MNWIVHKLYRIIYNQEYFCDGFLFAIGCTVILLCFALVPVIRQIEIKKIDLKSLYYTRP